MKNHSRPASASSDTDLLDPRIAADWQAVQQRLADLNSRVGGDSRRRAILDRLALLKRAS
jgi:hypothetical protein